MQLIFGRSAYAYSHALDTQDNSYLPVIAFMSDDRNLADELGMSREPVLYRSSCRPDSYRNMKYFVEHYTDEWLYKVMCKELRKRIKVKEYTAHLRLNEVT